MGKTAEQAVRTGLRKKEQRIAQPVRVVIVTASVAALAACATPAPPPPPPPPPPPQAKAIPYRPLPPSGASYTMEIPDKALIGKRETVNRNISDDEKVWYFRSAWNVAALNCLAPQFGPILTAYGSYISDHRTALKSVNDRIDREYREEAGARRAGILAREEVMTSVYNFFALPPARSRFCRAALDISNRAIAAPPTDALAFAMANFDQLEEPFELFFEEYEQYQRASAEWDSLYGAQYGASQPGWVAVQAARANGFVPPEVTDAPANTLATPTTQAGAVIDPETGATVPVIPVDDNVISQPVVEPVANDETSAQDSPQ